MRAAARPEGSRDDQRWSRLADTDADARAREIETQMTDDERFSLLVGVMGAGEMWPWRDERIPRMFR